MGLPILSKPQLLPVGVASAVPGIVGTRSSQRSPSHAAAAAEAALAAVASGSKLWRELLEEGSRFSRSLRLLGMGYRKPVLKLDTGVERT